MIDEIKFSDPSDYQRFCEEHDLLVDHPTKGVIHYSDLFESEKHKYIHENFPRVKAGIILSVEPNPVFSQLDEIKEILRDVPTRDTVMMTCQEHFRLNAGQRPMDCKYCNVDVRTYLTILLRLNEHLNTQIDRIRKIVEGAAR